MSERTVVPCTLAHHGAAMGALPQDGFKFGRWLDLAFFQLLLETPGAPVDGRRSRWGSP